MASADSIPMCSISKLHREAHEKGVNVDGSRGMLIAALKAVQKLNQKLIQKRGVLKNQTRNQKRNRSRCSHRV